ncbi:MAG: ABC transporter ATP-binding protein [Hyphomonadaceae bacterium]|nr:ABC transporter ATP-binding protein [Hyphomonadaceae bacterium]
MIRIVQARRVFGGAAAVDELSLDADEGEIVALLGPSGSGKSTILRMVAGLESLDGGEIRLDGELVSSVHATIPPEARRVGMVFQDFALFPHMNALGNVAFGLEALARAEREAAARAWLADVGLAARADAYPHELSGGEQQRVALARALAPRPRALLLDEPFSGLDPVLRAELRETTLAALRKTGTTALFVTHDAEEALYVADRIAILKRGKLVQAADPRTLYDRPVSVDAAAALGVVNTHAGVVAGACVASPFGAVTTELGEGTQAIAAVRAEAIGLKLGARALVRDKHPQGATDLVRVEAQGVVWRAIVPARAAPEIGASVDVVIDPAGAFVFSRE